MLESRVYKKWQTSARDRKIQSKIWSLADYLGELTAVPGNVMKHYSYYVRNNGTDRTSSKNSFLNSPHPKTDNQSAVRDTQTIFLAHLLN